MLKELYVKTRSFIRAMTNFIASSQALETISLEESIPRYWLHMFYEVTYGSLINGYKFLTSSRNDKKANLRVSLNRQVTNTE